MFNDVRRCYPMFSDIIRASIHDRDNEKQFAESNNLKTPNSRQDRLLVTCQKTRDHLRTRCRSA